MAKAQTTSENPQGEVSQQDTPVLPMQYDVRIHSIQFDGPCRATASLNINGCFAVRGVKLMEGSNGLFVSMPGQINSKGEIKDICFPYTREARAELESAVVTAYQQALTQGMNRSPQSAPDPTAQQAQKMGTLHSMMKHTIPISTWSATAPIRRKAFSPRRASPKSSRDWQKRSSGRS